MIGRLAFIFAIVSITASAQDPMPKFRLRMGETEDAYQWRETMTDGTVRESVVLKPKPPPQPVRVRLIATNDVGFAWRYDYEVGRDDGSVITNASFQPKPPRERLAKQLALERPTDPPMPDELVAEARGHVAREGAKRRLAKEMALNQISGIVSPVVTQKMANRIYAAETTRIDKDRLRVVMSNGIVLTTAVHRVVGKRIAALDAILDPVPVSEPEPDGMPPIAGNAIAAIIGAAAGAAAGAGLKRGKP